MNRATALALTLLLAGLLAAWASAQQATPTFGEEKMPTFGEVPMSSPAPASTPAPAAKPASPTPSPSAQPSATPAPASPSPAPSASPTQLSWGEQEVLNAGLHFTPTGWSGSYYAMVNGRLDKWDFYTDGTFLHEGVFNGLGAAGGTSQRGVYSIHGNTMTLQFAPPVSAYASAGALGAGQGPAGPPQTVSFRMIGPNGAEGIVLNGETMKWRDW